MKTNPLYPAQQDVVDKLKWILSDYNGAVLRGEEGTGKTIISAEVASTYEKVLYVGRAKDLKSLKAKMLQYTVDYKIPTQHIEFVSYHKFGNIKKLPASELAKYDFFIFDECQHLRNWSASWTKRFVKLSKRPFLCLSGTPLVRSPKDFIYTLRKCGLWKGMGMDDIYVRYFDAKQSNYGDFKEFGEFQNAACFQIQVDKVTVELKHTDIDKDMPGFTININYVEGEYQPPKDITEETETRKKHGIAKLPQVSKMIRKHWRENRVHTSLILCYFHETAKKLSKLIGVPTALTGKSLEREFARVKEEGGHLISTLGLTGSNFDLNECDNVYLAESTYSFALDRQSINRCRRVGKKNEVDVQYYAYHGEAPLLKSFQRKNLVKRQGAHAKMGPSSLKRLEMCPGSYWLPDTTQKEDYIRRAAYRGTVNHQALEHAVHNPEMPIDEHMPENIHLAVKDLRKLAEESDQWGCEDKVHADDIHPELWGTTDFWAYKKKNGTLYVMDYKNGSTPVDPKNNIQLQAYAYMVAHTKKLKVGKIVTMIYQRNEKKHCIYPKNGIQLIRRRLQRVCDRIQAAKKEPLKHLNKGKCDFFCTAAAYHKQQTEDSKMGKRMEKAAAEAAKNPNKANGESKVPVYTMKGKIFWSKEESNKLSIGVNFEKAPRELAAAYPKGSPARKLLEKDLKKNPDYGTRSIFLSGKEKWIDGETDVIAGDEVEVDFTTKLSANGDRLFYNIRKVTLLSDEAVDESVSDEVVEDDSEDSDLFD